nr:MAG TPA: hypothetical protein [Caudoviricetes sp.]
MVSLSTQISAQRFVWFVSYYCMRIVLQPLDYWVFPFYLLSMSALLKVLHGECNMPGVDMLEIKRGKQ